MSDLDGLLALIDEFHITDRSLRSARERVRVEGSSAAVEALLRAAAKYFGDMAAESEHHLAQLDRRLDDLYQRQYNLQAERSVAVRRRDGALRVLDALQDASSREQPR
ncbi:MAG: hypothetical protein JO219_02540 [Candidatus Eremiobacteraeota bacterium]|nr:hypothetical protein [Candidatus Eremiobacteraeota bacterium]MBV8367062.1 hypothetical protein [Candidatus Eremiobacteraeota bacterium]